MSKIKWLLILMIPLLTSCEKGGLDSFCTLAKPIYLDKADKLTPPTQREILSHDETGHSYCGWDRI